MPHVSIRDSNRGGDRSGAHLAILASVVASVLALFLGLAGRAFASATIAQPKVNGVTQKADDVEPPASLKSGIPIYDTEANAEAHPVVVYSVYAPGLRTGDALRVEGSTHMSYCSKSDISGDGNAGSPCRRLTGTNGAPDPYDYTVGLEMHAYQSSSPTLPSTATAPNATCGQTKDCADWLTYTRRDFPCTNFVHHCSFTVKNTDARANGYGSYINIEVVAWADPTDPQSSTWEPGQMLELEGDCTNASYGSCKPEPNDDQRTKSKGQLSVIRTGSGYSPASGALLSSETQFTRSALDINTSAVSSPEVVYSKQVQNVEKGDVIEAPLGRMDLDGTRPCDDGDGVDEPGDYCTPDPTYLFDHAVQVWWLLATNPNHAQPQNDSERYISANRQQNCWSRDNATGIWTDGRCTMAQLGAVTVPKPPSNHRMYLNLVAAAKDGSGASDPDGGAPKTQLSNGEFDLECNPLSWPDPGLPCHF